MKRIIMAFSILFVILLSGCVGNDNSLTPVQQIKIEHSIDQSLSNILNGPSPSSSPYDYINENRDDFDYIVSFHDVSLNYLLGKFEATNQDGLREYVMALICIDILGTNNPVKEWKSGRDWYQQYANMK